MTRRRKEFWLLVAVWLAVLALVWVARGCA